MNYNRVMFSGNIVRDLELKTSTNGNKYCKFTLAENEKHNGVKKTNFIPITCFGKVAENICKYATKGSNIFVEGYLSVEDYTDNEGKKRTGFSTIASGVFFDNIKAKGEGETENVEVEFNEEFHNDDYVPF